MRAYIINTGELHNDINTSFALATHALRSNPNPPAEWYTDPTYAVLIDHPTEGWILFDTGSAPDSNETWPEHCSDSCYWTPVEGATMKEQLALIGLTSRDIKHVIMSHMHMDHIGNIREFAETADCWVSRPEAEFAFTKVMSSSDPEKHGFYCKEDVLAPYKELHYIEEDEEIFPGVKAVILPGHTPGTMGVIAELDDRKVMIVSDALNAKRSYDGWEPGTVWSTLDWRKSLDKIKRLEKSESIDEIWFGHDYEQFQQMKKIPEHY